MERFDITVRVQSFFKKENEVKSTLLGSRIALLVSENLDQPKYFAGKNEPNESGAQSILTVLTTGLASIILLGVKNKILESSAVTAQMAGIEIDRSVCKLRKEMLEDRSVSKADFFLIGQIQSFFVTENGSDSQFIGAKYELEPSSNLVWTEYVQNGVLTKQGVHAMLTTLVGGIAKSLHMGDQRGFYQWEEKMQEVGRELQRLLQEFSGENRPRMGGGLQKSEKTTDVDLVQELERRNGEHAYDELITLARARYFHDFKQPKKAKGDPKIMLVEMLSVYPDLADIRADVIDGVYDEAPDGDDMQEMSDLLLNKK